MMRMSMAMRIIDQNGYTVAHENWAIRLRHDEADGDDPSERRAAHQQDADADHRQPDQQVDPTPRREVEHQDFAVRVSQKASSRKIAERPWIAVSAPIITMKTAAKTTQPTQPVTGSVRWRYPSGVDMFPPSKVVNGRFDASHATCGDSGMVGGRQGLSSAGAPPPGRGGPPGSPAMRRRARRRRATSRRRLRAPTSARRRASPGCGRTRQ